MNKKFSTRREDVEMVREKFLSPEEIFLLGFLKEFDRRTLMEWDKKSLWN